jgi:hypothetical protein
MKKIEETYFFHEIPPMPPMNPIIVKAIRNDDGHL